MDKIKRISMDKIKRISMDKTIEVKIEKVVTGGKGMGYHEGKVVFADFCAAGDVAVIKVTTEKKKYITGEVVSIKEPSPDRVEPACVYFGKCGGCSFWHVDYKTELSYKRDIFLDTLSKIGKVKLDSVAVIPAPSHMHYRNRVGFKSWDLHGKILFGFFKRGTNRVVDVYKCLIADERINALIPQAKKILQTLSFSKSVPQIDFLVGDEGETVIMLVHVISAERKKVVDELKSVLKDNLPDEVRPFLQFGRKSTARALFPEDADIQVSYSLKGASGGADTPISISPGSFLQVNYAQNLNLIDTLLEYLSISADDDVLDLYSGAGNFSFAAAPLCKSVTGIESYEPAVRDSKNNMKRLGTGNVKFICGDVVTEAKKLVISGVVYDSIIIDPPREGALSVLKEVTGMVNKRIVYISCDPATFSRDTAFLLSAGFELGRVTLVDMFPRTHHVEIVAEFLKK